MAVASAITLVRGFVVAALLDPAAFGPYVAIVAAGTFASNILSFGLVEATWKSFPRLWIEGHAEAIRPRADAIARKLAVRALLPIGMCAVAGVSVLAPLIAWQGVLVVVVALGAAAVSVYTSGLRAVRDLSHLGTATLARAIASLLLATAGAWVASWHGAVAGEILGVLVGTAVSRWLLKSAIVRSGTEPCEASSPASGEDLHGGKWLAMAFIIGAVPLYLDRTFASVVLSPNEAGTYGFLMLFAVGAAAAIGIISQKVGPQIVHDERSGATVLAQAFVLLRWVGLFWAASLLGMALMSWVLLEGPASGLGERYALDAGLMFVVLLLCCAQVTAMFDWILISRDRERQVFAAATIYLVAALMAAGFTIMYQLDVFGFVVAMSLAKLAHLGTQLAMIGRLVGLERAGVRTA